MHCTRLESRCAHRDDQERRPSEAGTAVSNFAERLPAPQSDLAQQALKDPYVFDFLTLEAPFRERELEAHLLSHLERFLLELGVGFAFVGRQYRVSLEHDDFYLDLLFYHLKLRKRAAANRVSTVYRSDRYCIPN